MRGDLSYQRVFSLNRYISLLLLAVVVCTLSHGTAEAGFFTGQSFNAPMENGTIYGQYINQNYATVTGAIWGSNLMKAGFFLTVLFTIIRIGFGAGGGLKDAGVYLLGIILLAGPLFNGKSLLIVAADASDSLTVSIVNQLGGLNYQFAGSAVATMMAQTTITSDVLHKWRNEIWYFRRDCYNVYNAQQPQGSPEQNPYDVDYGDMAVDPLTVFWNVDVTMTYTNCNDYKQKLADSLKSDFDDRLQRYKDDLGANGVTLSPQDQQLMDGLGTVTQAELENRGVYTVDHKPEDDKQPGLFDSLWKAVTTRQGAANLIMVMPRIAIALTGVFFVYIFNYYIFQLVTIIKIVAAIAMALGVLYYMFFRKLELPLAALGIWVFGNGWYVLAAIGMNQYWKTMQDTPWLSIAAQVLLGTQGAVTNGLFAVGLIGIAGSMLAGALSWKALHVSTYHMPGIKQAQGGGRVGGGKSGQRGPATNSGGAGGR